MALIRFEFFDRQFFDFLIYFVFGTGVVAAVVRLYQDFTRPVEPDGHHTDDETASDTRPRPPNR